MPTVLITGANRGIGLALVRRYAARPATDVVAVARDLTSADELHALARESDGRIEPRQADVGDEQAIAQLARELGSRPIELLINNAGVPGRTEFGAITSGDLNEVFGINTFAPLLVTQALRANLVPGAKVVNITSVLGSIERARGSDAYLVYGMSKAALNMLSVKLAAAFKSRGIAVLALHPGWVQTRMGGSEAAISVDVSADGIVRVVDQLDLNASGSYLAYDGSPIPC